MKQDLTQIITTAVFELRRAWKIYANLHKYLFNLFKKLEPNAEDIYGTVIGINLLDEVNGDDDYDDELDNHQIINESDSELNLNSVKNLLASVSFGYGIIQLCFSFLQPNILKLLKFIGKHLGLCGTSTLIVSNTFFISNRI